MNGGSGFSVFAGPAMLRASVVVIIALVLAGLRVAGVTNKFYKTAAHFYVAGLLGYFYYSVRDGVPDYGVLWVAVALSIVELLAFLAARTRAGNHISG